MADERSSKQLVADRDGMRSAGGGSDRKFQPLMIVLLVNKHRRGLATAHVAYVLCNLCCCKQLFDFLL